VLLRMDVTSEADVRRARRRIERLTDGLDGLACCAGIFRAGPLVEAADEDLRRILEVNVMGAFRVVREFFPLLRRRAGTVVLIGSESSRCPMPFNGPYTISKAALDAYAHSLRRELMFVGVPVALVQPGAFRTALLGGVESEMRRVQRGTLFSEQLGRVRGILAREWSRGMQPQRVARVVLRALRARRPRAFYRVGNDRLRAALGKPPARLADHLIQWFV
jgi:NAD(P)-dependent dehydrogenase (short-subunit alcohol dehydrogenase family)